MIARSLSPSGLVAEAEAEAEVGDLRWKKTLKPPELPKLLKYAYMHGEP